MWIASSQIYTKKYCVQGTPVKSKLARICFPSLSFSAIVTVQAVRGSPVEKYQKKASCRWHFCHGDERNTCQFYGSILGGAGAGAWLHNWVLPEYTIGQTRTSSVKFSSSPFSGHYSLTPVNFPPCDFDHFTPYFGQLSPLRLTLLPPVKWLLSPFSIISKITILSVFHKLLRSKELWIK